jgi:hypothetical protein
VIRTLIGATTGRALPQVITADQANPWKARAVELAD